MVADKVDQLFHDGSPPTDNRTAHAGLPACLPRRQSNLRRHRAWSFAHSVPRCVLCLLDWMKANLPMTLSGAPQSGTRNHKQFRKLVRDGTSKLPLTPPVILARQPTNL